MKFKPIFCLLFGLLPSALFAHWQPLGKADYNWGPFLVYSLSLYTESGDYKENEFPLMLTFTYDKQIEGKNFAVSLIKEIDSLQNTQADTSLWLKELQRIFPDFSPNDHLSYIALAEKGYFVLNDTVLDFEFTPEFSRSFIDIWLGEKTNFPQIKTQLLNKSQNQLEEKTPTLPENVPQDEENIQPQVPPEHPLDKPENCVS